MYDHAHPYMQTVYPVQLPPVFVDDLQGVDHIIDTEDIEQKMYSLGSINRLHEPVYLLGPSGTGKSFTVNFYLGLWNELFMGLNMLVMLCIKGGRPGGG